MYSVICFKVIQSKLLSQHIHFNVAKRHLYTVLFLVYYYAWIVLSLDLLLDLASMYNGWIWLPYESGVRGLKIT